METLAKMYKVFALFIPVALVASAHQVYGEEILYDTVDDLWHNLQGVVHRTVTEGSNSLMNGSADFKQKVAEGIGRYTSVLYAMQVTYRNELNTLKQKATKASVNIDQCLGEDEAELVSLVTTSSLLISRCTQNLLDQVTNYVDDVRTKIQKLAYDVDTSQDEITNCRKSRESAACLAKLEVKLKEEIDTIPRLVTNDVESVLKKIDNAKASIEPCGLEGTDHCKSRGDALWTKISNCAEKIIH